MKRSIILQSGKPLVPVDAATYREGMSHMAAAVHLVTTEGPAGRAGLTATAVTSVTDDPATLMVCINSLSHSGHAVEQNGFFAVNVLPDSDRTIAEAFGGSHKLPWSEKFNIGQWDQGLTGCPLLATALVSFDCRIIGNSVVATHRVLLGEVVDVRIGKFGDPLLYFERKYRSLSGKN
jgi:flavin reductase